MAMVIGPTPPGTGVIKEAFLLTFSKSTSPVILYPFGLVGSSTLVIPTSIITASSFTISAFRKLGTPNAEIIISAWVVIWAIFLVLLWVSVTVLFPGHPLRLIKILIGLPTIWLLPITTVCFPLVSTL